MANFDPKWRRTKQMLTHKYEYLIESILNQQLYKYEMRARRVEENPGSPYDLGVYNFNYTTLKYGDLICKLDLERKPDYKFPEKEVPPHWVRDASFLQRKTRKEINHDRDAYMLFDNDISYPRCIWINYGDLRDFGIPKEYPHWGEKNEFLEIKKGNYHLLNFGYRSFVNWCYKIKNHEIVSDKEQYQMAGERAIYKYTMMGWLE